MVLAKYSSFKYLDPLRQPDCPGFRRCRQLVPALGRASEGAGRSSLQAAACLAGAHQPWFRSGYLGVHTYTYFLFIHREYRGILTDLIILSLYQVPLIVFETPIFRIATASTVGLQGLDRATSEYKGIYMDYMGSYSLGCVKASTVGRLGFKKGVLLCHMHMSYCQ